MELLISILLVVIIVLLVGLSALKRKNGFQAEVITMQTEVLKDIHQKLGEARVAIQVELLKKQQETFEKPKRPQSRPRKNV